MWLAALVAAIAACAVAAPPAPAASLPAGSTALLSGQPSLFDSFAAPVGFAGVGRGAVSQDGRYVAFTSTSDGLLAGDDDRATSVYRKDMETGEIVLVSRRDGANGEPSHGLCSEAAISDDGLVVAFVCAQPLDDADKNGVRDVYVRKLATATTTLVSRVGATGAAGNNASRDPALSQNGDYVAFTSDASDLVAGVGQSPHVYRRHLPSQETILVGRKSGAAGAPVDSSQPSITDDGLQVAFASDEAVDAIADTNGLRDVYLRDVGTATTALVSRANTAAGAVGNGSSSAPQISGNGLGVVFDSQSTNLDTRDTDNQRNVYLRTGLQFTSVVDVNAAGVKSGAGFAPSIDDSSHLIAFLSTATALDPAADSNPAQDAYVKNVADKSVRVVSRASGPDGAAANRTAVTAAISGDGEKAVSALVDGGITPEMDPRKNALIHHDLATQTTRSVARPPGTGPFVNQGGDSEAAALSADGRFAAFRSQAAALGLPRDPRHGIFVRDRVTGSVALASRADGPDGAPFARVTDEVAISADGRRVAFVAREGDLLQVWVRDLVDGRTFLASRADGPAGVPGDGASYSPKLDADGSRVVFGSRSKNLDDDDADELEDVHVRDLTSGDTILVSRATGAMGLKSNGASYSPDIDAGGTRVSFISEATNLGDNDAQSDLFLRDLGSSSTRLVNATPAGTKGNNGVFTTPAIDAGGERVAFASPATNLGDTSSGVKVFVRDLAANTLALVGRGRYPVISPDGRYVAFADDQDRVLRHDLATLQTEVVSRRGGADGAPATDDAEVGDISTGGACVSFATRDTLVGPPQDVIESYLRVLAANCGDVPGGGAGGGSGTPGSGGPGASALDSVAPVLSDTRLSRRRFRVARAATPVAAVVPRGTVLTFRSSEAATLRIAIHRVRRTQPRLRAAGRLTRRIAAGTGRVRFTGRIGRRALRPGAYRLRVTAVDAAGNRSVPRALRFRVVQ